jgi:hypothetical protein
MGRPKSITRHVQDISVEAVRRVRLRMAENPAYQLTERDAKVIKTLAEAQVILQKRHDEKDEDEEGEDGPGMSIEELEASTAAPAPVKPTAEEHDDDA